MKINASVILLFITLTLLVLVVACQDVYHHDDFDDSKIIPVIEGSIHNGNGPHILSLLYARPYNNDRYTNITGAEVTVIDNLGNIYAYDDSGMGKYICPEGRLDAQIGRSYFLHIELPDGTILESDPAMIPDTLSIERVYEEKQQREVVDRLPDNEISVRNEWGTATYIVIDPDYPDKTFYRVYAFYSVHLYHYEVGISYEYVDDVEWVVYTHSVYDCMHSLYWNSLPQIGVLDPDASSNEYSRTELCFFLPDNRTLGPDTLEVLGKYLTIKLFNFSRETYNYISAINEQLSSTSHLFDPIPTQIRGNMHCVNNPEQEVLGLFEVSSLSSIVPIEVDTFPGCIYEFWETRRIVYENDF